MRIHKYQLKKNESGENDLILNKRMTIEDLDDSETDVDYVPVKTGIMQAIDATNEEIHHRDKNTLINLMDYLTFNGSKETLQVKGKTLAKQEAIFTDNTRSICIVLWEKDVSTNDYWHLLQHQKQCCHGMWRNQGSDTHKAQHN